MSGSTYGTLFRISTWGESHGKGLGVVVDGCPGGLALCEEDIQIYLNRRKPGQSRYSTPRKEGDSVEILSGVFQGKTTGTPISMIVRNEDQRSRDYGDIAEYYRPGHADYTFDAKYGFRDYRGGGRSSGRETIGRVAAGAIAAKLLREMGVTFTTFTKSIGPVSIEKFSPDEINCNPFYMPDKAAAERASSYLEECMSNQDSAGGIVECRIANVPPGIGEPVFHKLDACLAHGIMSIGAVKGVEIGAGMDTAKAMGHENNDVFRYDENGKIYKESNYAGGVLGGISDGSEILLRAAIKPTPSISRTQSTINRSGENIDIHIKGRHDPVIVPRAVVVVESMAAITLLDLMMENATSKLSNLKKIYAPQ